MGYNFNNQTPIYLQILECIKTNVITGVYKPNQKLPSVREFSASFCVNPNTIQKALQELEELGLIYTERTSGKFVTKDISVINKAKKDAIRLLTTNFLQEASKLGISQEEIIKTIKEEDILWTF